MQLFEQYNWPGNVRELEHIVERLCTINHNQIITKKSCGFLQDLINNAERFSQLPSNMEDSLRPGDLSNTFFTASTSEMSWNDLSRKIQNTEKEAIIQALLQTNGNKAKAARLLNIDRSSLYYKLKKYNITE